MTTATKTKPELLEHVQIEAASGRFIPPPADRLPESLHEARERVVTCRAAWLRALNRKRAADRIADEAKAVHRVAQNLAALDGQDVAQVPDERPAKYAAQAQAVEAADAALDAVEQRWFELAEGITDHRRQILDAIDPDVAAAETKLAEVEQAAAKQRAHTERLRSQRHWLATLERSATGRPSTQNGSAFAP